MKIFLGRYLESHMRFFLEDCRTGNCETRVRVSDTKGNNHGVLTRDQQAHAPGGLSCARRKRAVYLHPAAKYRRLTPRLSREQKGLDERARMASQWPSPP